MVNVTFSVVKTKGNSMAGASAIAGVRRLELCKA
ncbi:hypothetical protein Gotri_007333, partial [Gossypium trilobum]|nr:hypothetical protein [Gossypium trilobum]